MVDETEGVKPAINLVDEVRTPEEQSLFEKEVESLFKMADAYEEIQGVSLRVPANRAERRAMSKNARKARRKSRG